MSYSTAEVKAYMERVLGDTAAKLRWSAGDGDFDEPAKEVHIRLGDDLTDVDTGLVRAVSRVEVWRAAMYYTVHEASFSAGAPGTGSTNRADIHRQAKAMYEMASSELTIAYPDYAPQATRSMAIYPVTYSNDPYSNDESVSEWSRNDS